MDSLACSTKRKQGKCHDTCDFFKFSPRSNLKKSACWGAPQTRNFGTSCPEVGASHLIVAEMSLSLHFLVLRYGLNAPCPYFSVRQLAVASGRYWPLW